jgi:predicted DNA-binding transcriptional regulator AlpA
MSSKLLPSPFLRAPQAAQYVGLSPRTLEKYRGNGTGPKYSKIGGRILYATDDLTKWVELGAHRSTADPRKIAPANRVVRVLKPSSEEPKGPP